MDLFYAILSYALAAYNFYTGLGSGDTWNLIMAGTWLAVAIGYTMKHVKKRKEAKDNENNQEREN